MILVGIEPCKLSFINIKVFRSFRYVPNYISLSVWMKFSVERLFSGTRIHFLLHAMLGTRSGAKNVKVHPPPSPEKKLVMRWPKDLSEHF